MCSGPLGSFAFSSVSCALHYAAIVKIRTDHELDVTAAINKNAVIDELNIWAVLCQFLFTVKREFAEET